MAFNMENSMADFNFFLDNYQLEGGIVAEPSVSEQQPVAYEATSQQYLPTAYQQQGQQQQRYEQYRYQQQAFEPQLPTWVEPQTLNLFEETWPQQAVNNWFEDFVPEVSGQQPTMQVSPPSWGVTPGPQQSRLGGLQGAYPLPELVWPEVAIQMSRGPVNCAGGYDAGAPYQTAQPAQLPVAAPVAPPTKRGPGRPRKHPRKDPNAPKNKPGRPKGKRDTYKRLEKGEKAMMTKERYRREVDDRKILGALQQ
ncbi:uncharacterized protein K460DRAFT_353004 [Cucurbitaria berberidis CBS 394.84]|uniref:Uncharacterized protein n=1 Tax=Cucurbitaria berberidis CBS 394.84 TaxID=1168544 RepID=A0A9P4LB22_9PLEO|nr:uncharacterized protein K460DRAFT_353004 [Cucurbitaria berberidis CBS 394.84]KAF1847942.1 hypothetical protein K460DRAFT_353004 [Cucurbitaria berberidis CBS 394.84]